MQFTHSAVQVGGVELLDYKHFLLFSTERQLNAVLYKLNAVDTP
jgi:hypothetical protein